MHDEQQGLRDWRWWLRFAIKLACGIAVVTLAVFWGNPSGGIPTSQLVYVIVLLIIAGAAMGRNVDSTFGTGFASIYAAISLIIKGEQLDFRLRLIWAVVFLASPWLGYGLVTWLAKSRQPALTKEGNE